MKKIGLIFLGSLWMLVCATVCQADVPEPEERIVWHQPYNDAGKVAAEIAILRAYSHYLMGRHYHYIPCIALVLPGPAQYKFTLHEQGKGVVHREEGSYETFGERVILFELPVLKNTKQKEYTLRGEAQYFRYKKEKKGEDKNKSDLIHNFMVRIIDKGDKNYTYTLLDKNGQKENFAFSISYSTPELKNEASQAPQVLVGTRNPRKEKQTRNYRNENLTFVIDGRKRENVLLFKDKSGEILKDIVLQ